jgi:hypothetical protein
VKDASPDPACNITCLADFLLVQVGISAQAHRFDISSARASLSA